MENLSLAELKKELKKWQSQDVKERFESVGSNLHILKASELKIEIKRRKILKHLKDESGI